MEHLLIPTHVLLYTLDRVQSILLEGQHFRAGMNLCQLRLTYGNVNLRRVFLVYHGGLDEKGIRCVPISEVEVL